MCRGRRRARLPGEPVLRPLPRPGPDPRGPAPLSRPEHHDELLFIVQHQTSELWLKLVLHELGTAADDMAADELAPAQTPGPGEARPAHADRAVVGAGHADPVGVRAVPRRPRHVVGVPELPVPGGGVPARQQERRHAGAVRRGPGRARAAGGGAAPAQPLRRVPAAARPPRLRRPVGPARPRRHRRPHPARGPRAGVRGGLRRPADHWDLYETCEELVDVEENFQLWRFRHLKTVERTIGVRRGTGGSSGRDFLRRALDLTFFPELYDVRTAL